MSLKYAILGLLTFEPMSGYTLKTRYFDRSVTYFWPADQAQIYRTLQSLEAGGLTCSEVVDNETRPNQRRHTITDSGRTALVEWLGTRHPLPAERFPFLVQLYFCRLLERDQLIRIVQDQKRRHEEKHDHYTRLRLPDADNEDMRRQLQFGGFTLDFARRYEAMQIDWLDSVLEEIQAWT